MDDKTLVERLRMTGKRISIPCPDGIDGCLVNHFRIETDPLCDEAATRIEALEAALRDAPAALNAMAAQVEAELRDHDKAAARHDLVVQTFRKKVRDALESKP